MVDANHKKPKKGTITEQDVCNLLQRYSAGTVLALLKETLQCVGVKIDWNALMEKTETGIKSAREYQRLWRHLAYCQPLVENIPEHQRPLDDDSDLEYEVEACPPVSTTDALEASNCVRALTSGSANKSRIPNSSSFEVPKASLVNSQVPKQAQAAGTFGLYANGSTSNNQKKRKPSEEEVIEVDVAIKKEVKGERNTIQRAQKANTNRKKGSSNQGRANTAHSQLTPAQLATRHALDMALKDSPASGSATVCNGQGGSNTAATISASKSNVPVTIVEPQSVPQPCVASAVKPAAVASSTKLCPKIKDTVSVDSLEATAKAAGARVYSSDSASILKAVQSKNVVHIRGGASLLKTSVAGNSSPLPASVHISCSGSAASRGGTN